MKILCLGNSNTYGYDPRGYFGGRYDRCWPELLGTNDLLRGASAEEAGARMDAFLRPLCRQRSIVLICPPSMQRGA